MTIVTRVLLPENWLSNLEGGASLRGTVTAPKSAYQDELNAIVRKIAAA